MTSDWLYAVVALLSSAVFTGAELIFLSVNKLQLELLDREGSLAGKIMLFMYKIPGLFFTTTLVGHMTALICLVFFIHRGIVGNRPDYSMAILIIVVAMAALAILTVGYIIPRSWASINLPKAMLWVIIPFTACFVLLCPVSYLLLVFFRFITREVFRMEYPDDRPLIRMASFPDTRFEKRDASSTLLDEEIVNNALEFKHVKVRDCMVPRTEITAVEANEGIEQLRRAFQESGFSKIIIFRKTIDDIIGYCHSSSLFRKPASIQEIIIPIITAPETTPANELMMRFIHEKKNFAVVMDEFGGTSGIVSAEDIIEEIFGAVDNEPEELDLVEQKLDEHTFLFNARLEIDYLNEAYDLNLPPGDYDTLAGLLLSHSENMPSPGEIIRLPPYKFLVQTISNNRIGIVKIVRETPENGENPPSGLAG